MKKYFFSVMIPKFHTLQSLGSRASISLWTWQLTQDGNMHPMQQSLQSSPPSMLYFFLTSVFRLPTAHIGQQQRQAICLPILKSARDTLWTYMQRPQKYPYTHDARSSKHPNVSLFHPSCCAIFFHFVLCHPKIWFDQVYLLYYQFSTHEENLFFLVWNTIKHCFRWAGNKIVNWQ